MRANKILSTFMKDMQNVGCIVAAIPIRASLRWIAVIDALNLLMF